MKKIAIAFLLVIFTTSVQASELKELIDKVMPSIVLIEARTEKQIKPQKIPEDDAKKKGFFKKFFKEFSEFNRGGLGSGFFISSDGYIITNYHVVKNSDKVFVVDHAEEDNEVRMEAELVGFNSRDDIALLKVDVKDHPFVSFSDEAPIEGQQVIAVGSPFGLVGTVTTGIISAVDRDLNSTSNTTYIQTDAAINKGNSGGPLFDLEGRVVGINTLIYSAIGENMGLGFAIPAKHAKKVIAFLKTREKIVTAFLGILYRPINEELAAALDMPGTKGVIVIEVKVGSPAAEAGMKVGDVIIEFNGTSIKDSNLELVNIVTKSAIDEPIGLKVFRDYKEVELTVSLEEFDKIKEAQLENIVEVFGMSITVINEAVYEKFDLPKGIKGMVVMEVEENSQAAVQNVAAGMVILDVNQTQIKEPKKILELYNRSKAEKKPMLFLFLTPKGLFFKQFETK